MAFSPLLCLVLSAFVLCGVATGKKEILKDELAKIGKTLKAAKSDLDLPKKCSDAVPDLPVTTETKAFSACDTLKADKTKLAAACTEATYDKLDKAVCDAIKNAETKRTKRIAAIAKTMKGTSAKCKTKIPATQYKDWTTIDALCANIQDTMKTAIEKECPGDDYGNVKDAVCGAASLVIGLVAFVFSFMAHAYKFM